jgi:murein DD-endopeptidase MepM/ murein hydrolase activator NlpD
MSEGVAGVIRRNAFRFAMTGIVGIWLSGCADSTRFTDSSNPFSNPFNGPSGGYASNDGGTSTPRVSSQPLSSAQSYNHNYATAARPSPSAVAVRPTPAPMSTGSINPRSEAVGGTSSGWTAVGGSPIVVGQSDDAASLSARYGVPEAALLSANGLHSRSELHANMRIVIPVFNARGAGPSRVAQADDNHDLRDKARHDRRDEDRDADRDSRKSDRADDDHRKHHDEAGRDRDRNDDDRRADDDRSDKKAAKADKHKKDDRADRDDDRKADKHNKDDHAARDEDRKVAKTDKRDKDKLDKSSKSEKSAKTDKPREEVAAVETPKASRKAEVDRSPTGNVAQPSASADADADGKFRWPARGRIIQGFKSGGNDGINISLPEGTSVRAAEDGKVAYAGSGLKGYGKLVLIRHSNGFVSAYANNGELDVKLGDTVKRGQVIAKSGATGDVSTPQLHFELRKGQTPVDPTSYLAGL